MQTTQAPGGVDYDGAGEITNDGVNRYLYDADGHICAVSGKAGMTGYLYNAEGERVEKGSITNMNSCDPMSNGFRPENDYILGPGGEELTEMTANSDGVMAWKDTNVYAAGQLMATYDGAGLHFLLNDPLGTRRAQTNYAGVLEQTCASLPFGDGLACSDSNDTPNPLHFTGKERDAESNNDYFGARYYSSNMGRWMSPDPVTVTDKRILNPVNTLNLYTYGADNPLKYVDSDGQDITYFYDQGGVAGHAVLFAYNQGNGDSAIESFGPNIHAPVGLGESDFDMAQFKSAQDLRNTYAAITIQTNPELTQEVINYIRQNPDPLSGL
jgi:RHS repeat-associated protein